MLDFSFFFSPIPDNQFVIVQPTVMFCQVPVIAVICSYARLLGLWYLFFNSVLKNLLKGSFCYAEVRPKSLYKRRLLRPTWMRVQIFRKVWVAATEKQKVTDPPPQKKTFKRHFPLVTGSACLHGVSIIFLQRIASVRLVMRRVSTTLNLVDVASNTTTTP